MIRASARIVCGTALAAIAAAALLSGQARRTITPITDDLLAQPSANDWLAWRGTSRSLGYSPLTQITRDNVSRLQVVWSHTMKPGKAEAAPIVHDGVLYLAHNGGVVEALDGATGEVLWNYTPSARDGQAPVMSALRGLAMYGSNVIVGVPDGRLVSLDAATGKETWSTAVTKSGSGLRYSTAPVITRGGIIVSALSDCNFYTEEKCAIIGHDARTGRELWRSPTVPAPGSPGSETWGDLPYLYRSGTGMWIPGSYDPELNLVYWSTSQAKPWARASRGTDGDALYSNSTLALDPQTGKIVWYRQTLPGETHDLDEVFENVLIDAGPRRSLFKMGKISILWELDRRTGKILHATDMGIQDIVDLNPTTGAVTYRPEKIPKADQPIDYCPSPLGGKNWPSMAYSPETQALFIPYMPTCAHMTFLTVEKKPGGGGMAGTGLKFDLNPKAGGKAGVLAALDLNGKVLWEHRQRAPFVSASITTASGLLFISDFERYFYAFDQKTGDVIWKMQLPIGGHGFPAVYAVDGRQYIALPVGPTTTLEGFGAQFVPEIPVAKGDNGIVVLALPSSR